MTKGDAEFSVFCILMIPVLIVFLVAQRQLVGGIASTGIRG